MVKVRIGFSVFSVGRTSADSLSLRIQHHDSLCTMWTYRSGKILPLLFQKNVVPFNLAEAEYVGRHLFKQESNRFFGSFEHID